MGRGYIWCGALILGWILSCALVDPRPPAPAPASAHAATGVAIPPGHVFRDCPTCPEMVSVPPGKFIRGSSLSEADRFPNEGPPTPVRIPKGFALGKHPVTVEQYAAFVRETGRKNVPACFSDRGGKYEIRQDASWRDPGFPQQADHPVVCVSWKDALAYVGWLGKKSGHTYRLPSESEWEYAARAGSTTRYWWGDQPSRSRANYGAEHCCSAFTEGADRWGHTAPVGSYPPNRFGLYGMAGNVWQYTDGCYNTYAITFIDQLLAFNIPRRDARGVPTDGTPSRAGDCSQRVLRGGSWLNRRIVMRSASRFAVGIEWGGGAANTGFRVARDF